MPPIINIAAYKFAELGGLARWRNELRTLCRDHQLKGTILLSPEGINLFVAGSREGIDVLLDRVRTIPNIGQIDVKESVSRELPFNRMLVKIKREIIAFGVEGIDPLKASSPRISARELKRWLDEGHPVTLLDTRNDFEVTAGTFDNAIPIGVDNFRDFPAAVKQLPESLKQQPVVTFCTGGIRCEKAAPLLEREGFAEVYQLDGGILKYFDECGGEHYNGECFVFDKRVAVDANLHESPLRMCFACQAILSVEEQASPRYVEGISCSHCFRPAEETLAELLARRHDAIKQATTPLPGSAPYDNVRPIRVPQRFDGCELLDFLDAIHTRLTREEWIEVCQRQQLQVASEAVSPGDVVRAGDRLCHLMPATQEPDVNANIEILHEDDALVIVHKPAPLPMHPCGRFNRNTLRYILQQVYDPIQLRAAHRLDADTSGVVVLCKSRQIAGMVQEQFVAGQVKKSYLARVHGRPTLRTFDCQLPIATEPGLNGVRLPDDDGQPACTRFQWQQEFTDGTTLLEVQPLTGRTNQIRVHLWALGLPIVGDGNYLPDQQLGEAKTRDLDDDPLCLHAATIELTHPLTQECVIFTAETPKWANLS